MAEIRIVGLVAGYDSEPILRSIDLTIPSGSLTCVLGPSGCGKTTLLRVIAGFMAARSGTVHIGEQLVDDGRRQVAPERRGVGYVPQDGALFPHLDVAGNVGFALPRTTRDQRRLRAETVSEMLELVGMPDMGSRLPHQLSGGQQQRVAVARALADRPALVLLDEPFASLDASLRDRLREDIRDVLRRAGVTAVLVTHDRSEALSVADQIAVIDRGQIHQVGTPFDVYTRPADEHVARFVGDANVIDGTLVGGTARTPLGALQVDAGCVLEDGAARVVVRPENVRLRTSDATGGSDAEGVAADVTRVEYFGHDARIELRVPDAASELIVSARIAGAIAFSEGQRVRLCVVEPVWAVSN
ncbi:MAG: transporter related [Ilumatobacteraceae bacterium]|nr:transporter related [Ilumatobacteraceae bacterium]